MTTEQEQEQEREQKIKERTEELEGIFEEVSAARFDEIDELRRAKREIDEKVTALQRELILEVLKRFTERHSQ